MSDTTHAREQAEAQLHSIRQLMEWLDHANECDGEDCYIALGAILDYGADGTTAHDADRAQQAIHEHPLSVEVNDGWRIPGERVGPHPTPEKFRILLSTGGPACRIAGTLDEHGEPERCWMEYQDWGTPWIAMHDFPNVPHGILLRYCQQFYFGG